MKGSFALLNNRRLRAGGFSLIELLTAVAIVALLAGIAYPSYTSHVTATRRASDGQSFMLQMASRLEKFYTSCGSYTATIVGGTINGCTGLEYPTANSPALHYTLNITLIPNANGVATGYTINAVPQGTQASRDTDCATLTLDNRGYKDQTGPNAGNRCWKK